MEKVSQERSIIINVANTQYDIIKSIASEELNWTLSEKDTEENWDICWQDFAISPEKFADLEIYQKINHFPGMGTLSRKNNLASNLNIMQKVFPDDYNFFPETWVLPKDLFDLKNRAKFNILIVKPESSCQGKGISLIKRIEDLPERCVAQRYISRPFLIDNLKFDLRLYVLITGCDPLRIFLHEDGLVRFATEEYKEARNNLENLYMHLTNYAINKNNPKFQFEPSGTFMGHKRTLSWLWSYLEEKGHNVDALWREIAAIIVKTIISGAPCITHLYRSCHPDDPTNSMCFEVLGFDVILDQNLKPWLLEVNHTPSFTVDSQIDLMVKKSVIIDALNLLNITPQNRTLLNNSIKSRLKDRNLLKIKEYKKWKEKQANKWRFSRDIFEQQQESGFVKIYPDFRQIYVKFMDVANQIWSKSTIPKIITEQEEETIIRQVIRKKISLPKLRKKWEALSRKRIPSPQEPPRKEETFVFRALPVPRRLVSRIDFKPKKNMSLTGNYLIPKVMSYQGEQAQEENKSFMKWKLIKQTSEG
ncbi:hypothetical protein SteCoe_13826 [Stentor coeruleus]|uniref:Uncharacterized protein n=1 Tax=Stentor coeruleus TaxID=5963 RepID=A0A1R2C7L8_9CILI|nr:hypothetical protein SteCoe_13826 [Stentor coeruleus]